MSHEDELMARLAVVLFVIVVVFWVGHLGENPMPKIPLLPRYVQEYMRDSCLKEASKYFYPLCRYGTGFDARDERPRGWSRNTPSFYCGRKVDEVLEELREAPLLGR